MSTDENVDFTSREPIKFFLPQPPLVAAGKDINFTACASAELLQGRQMLSRENLRRRHNHTLSVAFHRAQQSEERDYCFTATYVALEQT